jgi:hypothetical protein
MPPTIVCITRSPVDPNNCNLGTIDLTNLSSIDPNHVFDDLNSTERIISKLKEWMNGCNPALLGVEPETLFNLYVFDRTNSTSWRVVPIEWNSPKDLKLDDSPPPAPPNPSAIQFSIGLKIKILGVEKVIPVQIPILEIRAYLPDMSFLEASNNYQRNGLVMAMGVKVVNNSGEESNPWLPFPIWLPPPMVDEFVWDEALQQVTVGFLEIPDPLHPPDKYSNYLGQKALRDSVVDVDADFGQVRWYSLDKLPRLGFLNLHSNTNPSGPPGQPNPCIPLPRLVADKLADLRRAGAWFYDPLTEVTHWDDNCVKFKIPAQPGVAVIWRDDLPSKPIACMNLIRYAFELANRLWRPVLSTGELDIDIPIPAGKLIQLGVTRLENEVNNELVKYLGNSLSVRFAFLANPFQSDPSRPSTFDARNFKDVSLPCLGSIVDDKDFQDSFEPGETGVSKKLLSFRYHPQITSSEITDEQAGAFTLQLNIIIEGKVTLLGSEVVIPPSRLAIGPALRFHPQPVILPNIWQPVLAGGTLDLNILIPVGEKIQLAVERLENLVNNELVKFIGHIINGNTLHVKFAFLASELKDAPNEASKFDNANFKDKTMECIGSAVAENNFFPGFDTGQPGVSTSILGFKYAPQPTSIGDLTDAQAGAFTLQLHVIFDGSVDLLGYHLDIPKTLPIPVGPALRFHPVPLKLPTIAIFFEHPNFQGTALVALPSGTGLFDGSEIHIDADSPDTLNQNRVTIINQLSRVKDLLNVVEFVWPNKPLSLVTQVVGEICDLGRSVIDSSGKIWNASDCVIEKHWYGDANFNDSISSVVLIGPPHNYTGTMIKCWEHSLRRDDHGRCLRLSLPDGYFIAAAPDFSHLLTPYPVAIGTSIISVELPYGPGDTPGTSQANFYDKVTGIEFVTEWP